MRSQELCPVQRGMCLTTLRAAQLPPVLPRPKIAEDALGFPCFSAEQAAGKWAEKASHEVAGHPAVVAEKPPVPGTARRFGAEVELSSSRWVGTVYGRDLVAVEAVQ